MLAADRAVAALSTHALYSVALCLYLLCRGCEVLLLCAALALRWEALVAGTTGSPVMHTGRSTYVVHHSCVYVCCVPFSAAAASVPTADV